MFGYHKKLLRVDLTNRKIEVEDLDEKVIRNTSEASGSKQRSFTKRPVRKPIPSLPRIF